MKKLIFNAALICAISLSAASAEASIVDKVQIEGGKVYAEGSEAYADKIYTVTVVKKGTDLQQLMQEKPGVCYQGEFSAGEDGSTEFMFSMPSGAESGPYIIRIGNDEIVTTFEFTYFSVETRQALIDKINGGVKTDIEDVLTNGSETLGLYLGAEAGIDMSGVCERIYTKVTSNPDYETVPTFTEESFIAFYKESVVIEAFAQGKSDFLIKNGFLAYDEYTGIDESAIYNEYKQNLTTTGIAYVNNAVISAKCSSRKEIAEVFEKNAAFAVISRYKEDGYGHVNEKITAYRKIYENRNLLNIDFTYYDKLTDSEKTTFARELDVKNITNAAALKEQVESTAKSIYQSRGSGEGGNGGTGGNGGSKVDVNIPVSTSVGSVFSDIGTVEWARESIEGLAKKKIVNGKSEGLFYPNDKITREEFAKIVCLAFNISTEGAISSFTDVASDAWYYPYVSALSQREIIVGVDNQSFGTGVNITREQMATIIARIADAKASSKEKFADDAQISDYAKDAVYAMKEHGIINGTGNNVFNPKGMATRAEAAKIVYGAINKFAK